MQLSTRLTLTLTLNLDWVELRKQKAHLLRLSNSFDTGPKERGLLSGVINLLDVIQDEAVDSGDASELEVFGELK